MSRSALAHKYGEVAYWDSRYQSGGPEHAPGTFDWFPSHGDKDPVISALEDAGVAKTGRILDIGCGNSQVCFKLREAGFTRVAGVDFSDAVISNMRRQNGSANALQDGHTQHFFTMDATNLSFSDESFDAVTEKGLLDSICFEHDHWYSYQKACRRGQEPGPSVQLTTELFCTSWHELTHVLAVESLASAGAALQEIGRILRRGGVYMSVSYEEPVHRLQILRGELHPEDTTPFATVEHSVVDREDYFFHLFTAIKRQDERTLTGTQACAQAGGSACGSR